MSFTDGGDLDFEEHEKKRLVKQNDVKRRDIYQWHSKEENQCWSD